MCSLVRMTLDTETGDVGLVRAIKEFSPDFLNHIADYAGDLRRESLLIFLTLAKAIGAKTIVETGTIRVKDAPDGQSTKVFAEYARLTGAKVYSVDITPEHIETSKSELGDLLPYVTYACEDSVTWLSRFNAPIDMLYLDSYDFEVDNPTASQQHELAEIGAAYGKLSTPGAVLLDDCALPFEGKGYLGTRFLQSRGWKMVFDGYQRLFINF